MSYYGMSDSMYRPPPAGLPGWQLAPVPGWGMNPARSGPPVLATRGVGCMCGVSGCSCGGLEQRTMTEGHVAFGVASGVFLGWLFASAYYRNRRR